jgi:molecular chaperone HscB
MDYYSLFGLPASAFIDRAGLARTYFELQKQHHPDFFTQATEDEKEEALKQSAAVNEGFRILQDEDLTIGYFLKSKGLIDGEDKVNLSPDFLMELMELNEGLLTVEEGLLRKKIAALQDYLKEKTAVYRTNYIDDGTEIQWEPLRQYYFEKKYLNRILERLGD